MKDILPISGIHHITAVTSSASENLAFYEKTLGLRLVKQTVNFDDPYTYHLYYGDAQGRPGTILTFFPWEKLPPGEPGAGMLTAIAFVIPRNAVDFWSERIGAAGIAVQREERFDEPVLRFADPHGLPLEVIGADRLPPSAPWTEVIPDHAAIRGFHSATATLPHPAESEKLLTDVMGMTLLQRQGNRRRYAMADATAPGNLLDLVTDPDAPAGRPGGGTFHHIAFRTRDDASQLAWQERLRAAGFAVTPVRDRHYFKSIYFHMPGGILFEIATDPPGFMRDEASETLGRTLKLPAQYEPLRAEIQSRLPWLRAAPLEHRFVSAETPADRGQTIVTLHGTGGSENDLIGLAGRLFPGAAVMSPRGQVSENGQARFFKRLAPNRFDEADIIQRAGELSEFLSESVRRYGRDPHHLTALGYSNGANMAAAILLLHPEIFRAAILLRPMLPLQASVPHNLEGKPILILKGGSDTLIPAESTRRLEHILRQAGAQVTAIDINAGHGITAEDLEAIKTWGACLEHPRRPCRIPENEAVA
jgi:predicted esterase/catechol 2,3-dioxygenase-like lactoylglutathione lyase family enzyme